MNETQKPTVVILAAGKNSRFFPLNTETHKGCLPLLGEPIIIRTLRNLEAHGFMDIVIVVSEKDFQGKGFSAEITKYNLNSNISWTLQPDAQGAGQALLTATAHLQTEHFIMLSPYYTNAGELAEELWHSQQTEQSECVFMGTQVENPSLYGMFEFDPEHANRVIGIVEKPQEHAPSNYKINSIYLLSKSFMAHLETTPQEEYSLEAALTSFAKDHVVTWVENTEELPSLKYSWHLFEMLSHIFENQKTSISPEANISTTAVLDDSAGPIIIKAGARIGDFAKIVGPCYIGSEAMVGDYCFVRGECSIEAGATVGANTEVVRAILLPKASIHFGYLADSILGQGVKVGAGLITANKRLDRAPIRTQLKGSMVTLPSNRQGVIIGAYANLGISVRAMPGILLGARTFVHPATTISKNTEHEPIETE